MQDFFHHQNEQNNHVNKYMMYKHVYLSKLMCTDETLSVRSVTSFIHAKEKQRVVKGRLLQTMVDDGDDSQISELWWWISNQQVTTGARRCRKPANSHDCCLAFMLRGKGLGTGFSSGFFLNGIPEVASLSILASFRLEGPFGFPIAPQHWQFGGSANSLKMASGAI